MLRTLKIKLHPSEEQSTILLATMERFNEACNWIAEQAMGGRVTNKIAIQKIVYYAVRERFGLSAQMVIRAIAKVAEAYKRDKTILPKFRLHGAIVYDERILSFDGLEFASIWTLQGRIRVSMTVCSYYRQIVGNSHVKGQADLLYSAHTRKWYLLLVVDTPNEPCDGSSDFLGVDLGIVNLAADSDGNIYTGELVERNRRIYAHRRRNLQRNGSRSAKRKLRELSGKQGRFQRDTNHIISKRLVTIAKDTQRGIALENLKGMRERTTVKRTQKARHANWAFYQLRSYIEYKAALAGVTVVAVDPRNSSRQCAECGYIDKANRPTQSLFLCKSCGYFAIADYNAARNLRVRAASHAANGNGPSVPVRARSQLQATAL